jgi:hypothetical protein
MKKMQNASNSTMISQTNVTKAANATKVMQVNKTEATHVNQTV